MIDLRAEQSFGRFWLPLIILGLLVLVLFPSFGPRQERIARERWDGLIVVLTLAEPAEEPLRVLATMPLRARPRTMPLGPLEEERSLARERLVSHLVTEQQHGARAASAIDPPKGHRVPCHRLHDDRSRSSRTRGRLHGGPPHAAG